MSNHARTLFTSLLAIFLVAPAAIAQGDRASATTVPRACCVVVSVDAATGIATAKVSANGNIFQFKASRPGSAATLAPGQPVYANFANHQVSLDGRTACCVMTSAPQAAIASLPPATAAGASNTAASQPFASTIAGQAVGPRTNQLPSIAYGTPQPINSKTFVRTPTEVVEARQISAHIGGKESTGKVVRLRGLSGIEQSTDLPDGAKRLMEIHVRTLDPNQPHDYIVNTELAQQWMLTHPVPADIKPSDGGSHRQHCSGADYVTKANCDYQAAGDAVKAVQNEAKKDWNHASDELTHDWKMATGCFADETLSLPDIPIKFSIAPSLTIPLSAVASGAGIKLDASNSAASAKVDGSVGLGFPLEGDFVGQLDLFYIPCLPFVVRPKSIGANGTMTVGETLTANVSATGKFDKTFKIPPTGGPKIPIEMIPIVIAGVPVAELDVSAYIEGNVEVGGNGKAEGHFTLSDPHKARLSFSCDGSGCPSAVSQVADPATVSESAEIKGQVFVKPSVYTALQLDFDFDLLSARVGPQPYLLGMASGCVEGSASQATDGTSTSEENHALTADLDWGVELRAEALVAQQIVGKPYVHSVTGDKHLWFSDLAPGGSTALIPTVQGGGSVSVAHPASYSFKMPTCYPYTNNITYQVTWTGNATPSANSLCHWQASSGSCKGDPTRNLVVKLTWPTAGPYSLTVVPMSDDHNRRFHVAPRSIPVSVAAAPGG